jgi:alpha-1,6-mannosyltransferase
VPAVAQFGYLDRAFGEGDVVLASQWRIAVPALANGAILVVSPYPDAFTPDDAVRRAAVAGFFAPTAPAAERSAVIAKYHVKWVLWGAVDGPAPVALGAPVGTGPDKSRLYRVTATTFR